MYRRFLNNNDYIGIVTEEALSQLIRDKEERLAQAEEAAEESIVEYLSDNFEIEKVLAVGHNLRDYNPKISYPAGVHFYCDGKIYVTLRPLKGCIVPTSKTYWSLVEDVTRIDESQVGIYSQLKDYAPQDLVIFNSEIYRCLEYNGYSFNDIRIPGITGWKEVNAVEWNAFVEYDLWTPVIYNGRYYALVNAEEVDWSLCPEDSDNWGMIGEYTPDYEYETSDHEFVSFEGRLYVPEMSVNPDKPYEGYNMKLDDPRNANIKKHLLRLAVYELYKLISPNNVSSARITDYETSIMWLRDASKLKINPQIPRKVDDEQKPVTEYAIATFMRDYDPHKNPWQI